MVRFVFINLCESNSNKLTLLDMLLCQHMPRRIRSCNAEGVNVNAPAIFNACISFIHILCSFDTGL